MVAAGAVAQPAAQPAQPGAAAPAAAAATAAAAAAAPAPAGDAAQPKSVSYPIVCPGHSRPVWDVRFSAVTTDGVFLVSGCHDKVPMLRWGDNGDWIGSFEGHNGAVWSTAINSDATKVATGSGDYNARLFDAVTGELLHTFDHGSVVKSVDFSKKDDRLLVGGKAPLIKVYDLKAATYALMASLVTAGAVRKASWCYDPTLANDTGRIIAALEDGTVQVWDPLVPDKALQEWKLDSACDDLEVCERQRTITIAAGQSVYLYDLATFELRKRLDLPIGVKGVSLNPVTGATIVAGGSTDLWVHVFDVASGKELRSFTGHHGPIFCLRFHPEGLIYASGSEDGTVRLWKLDVPAPEE
jgi:serine-threonine kinase receptor-associated protein